MGVPCVIEVIDGQPHGWTGNKCPECKGHGVRTQADGEERMCSACGGTGEEYGPIAAPKP